MDLITIGNSAAIRRREEETERAKAKARVRELKIISAQRRAVRKKARRQKAVEYIKETIAISLATIAFMLFMLMQL